jgi:hypothetical protein
MKWQCCFGFIVPVGLLLVFPELSLVRYGRPYTMHMDEEQDIREFAHARSTKATNELS